MIIVLKQEAKTEDVTRIEKTIEEKGLQVHVSKGENQTIMGLIGDTTKVDPESIEVDPAEAASAISCFSSALEKSSASARASKVNRRRLTLAIALFRFTEVSRIL